MVVILNEKNEFYSSNTEFTTDFAKAKLFKFYGDAYEKYREFRRSGISVTIDVI